LDLEGADKDEVLERVAAACPPELGCHLRQGFSPVQWIVYEREYFVSFDGRIRVTLDTRVRCFDLRPLARVERSLETPVRAICVVEWKAGEEEEERLREALREWPFRPTRCSKYVLAARADEPMALGPELV
jgi:hypothetical protein